MEFPYVVAMAVRDPSEFKDIRPQLPVVIDTREHGIKVVGYDYQEQGGTCMRKALSAHLDISEREKRSSIVIDKDPQILAKSNAEGWKTYEINEFNSLSQIINQICL